MKELMNLPLRALPIVIILIIGFAVDIHLAMRGGILGIMALFLFSIKVTCFLNLINYYKKL